jgi:hypothetical protein
MMIYNCIDQTQSSPRRVAVPVLVKDGKPCGASNGDANSTSGGSASSGSIVSNIGNSASPNSQSSIGMPNCSQVNFFSGNDLRFEKTFISNKRIFFVTILPQLGWIHGLILSPNSVLMYRKWRIGRIQLTRSSSGISKTLSDSNAWDDFAWSPSSSTTTASSTTRTDVCHDLPSPVTVSSLVKIISQHYYNPNLHNSLINLLHSTT